jgi:hypothetical protein
MYLFMSLKLVTLRNSYNTAYVETPYTSKYRWVLVQLHQHELIHIQLSVMKLSWNIPYEKVFYSKKWVFSKSYVNVQTEFREKCPELTVLVFQVSTFTAVAQIIHSTCKANCYVLNNTQSPMKISDPNIYRIHVMHELTQSVKE